MKLIKKLFITALAAGWILPAFVVAGETAEVADKPSLSASQTVKIVTVVEAVDYETRMVTLKGPEGNLKTVKAENTPNLEEVQVGDQVNIEYVQQLSIEVMENDGSQPGQGVMKATGVNSPDEAPGGMEVVSTVTTATVAEINIEANTFKLNMPGGAVEEFTARDPENLKRAAVGDLVVITTTEAVAVYLAEVPAE
jgi:ribosomal protein S17